MKLTSTEPGGTFECRWERVKYKPCRRKFKLRGLYPRRYELRAVAIDADDNADPTPARQRFRIQQP